MPRPTEEKIQALHAIRVVLRTLPLLWQAEPLRTSLLTLILVVQGLLPAATLFLTKWTVDEVSALAGGAGELPILALAVLWASHLLLDPTLGTLNQLLQGSIAEK